MAADEQPQEQPAPNRWLPAVDTEAPAAPDTGHQLLVTFEVVLTIATCVVLPALPLLLLAAPTAGTTPDAPRMIATLLLQSLLFVLVGMGLRRRCCPPARAATPTGIPRRVGLGLVFGLAALAGSMILGALLTAAGLAPTEQPWLVEMVHSGGWQRLALLAITVLVVPPSEEALFRGYAFERLHRDVGPVVAYLLSATLFAAVHANPSAFFIYLFLGLVLARARAASGSLLSPIVAHSLNNAIAMLILLSG